jgi:hypothetical protein
MLLPRRQPVAGEPAMNELQTGLKSIGPVTRIRDWGWRHPRKVVESRLGPYRSNCSTAIVTAQVRSEAAVSKGQAGPLVLV